MDLGVMLTQERIDAMVGVGAWPNKTILDYVDAAFSPHNLTVLANAFYAGTDFHFAGSKSPGIGGSSKAS